MKIKSGLLLCICLFGNCFIHAQHGIDHKPKALIKALQKAGATDLSVIQEVNVPHSVNISNGINGKFFLINDTNVSQYRYIYVGRVNSCRTGGCSIADDNSHDSASEYFDYYILFDNNKKVQTVKVFNYQATHGHEITSKGWLKQFIGYDGSEQLQVDKNIDAISGATISVYAITLDVDIKTKILQQHI